MRGYWVTDEAFGSYLFITICSIIALPITMMLSDMGSIWFWIIYIPSVALNAYALNIECNERIKLDPEDIVYEISVTSDATLPNPVTFFAFVRYFLQTFTPGLNTATALTILYHHKVPGLTLNKA